MKLSEIVSPQRIKRGLPIVIVLLLLLAWLNRFIYDDAFITFRYAQHFAEGYGLVWNIGDAQLVEGYTNFLWTLLMSLAFFLSIDPVAFSWGIGFACFAVTLYFTYKLSIALLNDTAWALITVILLGTNYTFSTFATSGLETQFQAMLIIVAAWYTYQFINSDTITTLPLLRISLLFTALLLTRLDSAIVVVAFGLLITHHIVSNHKSWQKSIQPMLFLVLPMLIIVGLWLIWKLAFYGNLLPNTFYAKVGFSLAVFVRGLIYLLGFWFSYLLFPFPVLIGIAAWKRKFSRFESVLLAILVLWFGYLLYIGGDHIEFRFMVAMIPFLMILIVTTIIRLSMRESLRYVAVVWIVAGSLYHALSYDRSPFKTHQLSIPAMRAQHTNPDEDWDAIGRQLGVAFNYDRSVTIALNPVGVIPFYARSRTIDMLGLNDAWVARNGVPYLAIAAHEQIATFDYLLVQNVNLLIDQPHMLLHDEARTYTLDDLEHFHVEIKAEQLPDEAVFLEVPINDSHSLLTLYLLPHPTIDAAIERDGWRVFPVP